MNREPFTLASLLEFTDPGREHINFQPAITKANSEVEHMAFASAERGLSGHLKDSF